MKTRGRLAGRVIAYAVAISFLATAALTIGATTASAASVGRISGSVTSVGSGRAVSGICVSLYTTSGVRTADAPACTSTQGVYSLRAARSGSYDVLFSDPSLVYASQWYQNKPTQATAIAVQVRTGRTIGNINAAMVAAGAPPPVPTVTNVNPTSGTTAGGTSVTITGTNLSGATSVHFGATAGTINTNTATTITATSPAGAAATVDITVTTGGGTSATSSADHFTYTAPAGTITAVGTLQSHTNQPSVASEMISVSPAAAGNVLALAVEEKFPTTPAFSVATVSGGGVTTWHRALGGPTIDTQHGQELWLGTVTTPGVSTITVTFTAASAAGTSESATSLDVQEFHSSIGAGTVWAVDASGVVDTGTPTTTPHYPALTPTGSHEAYFGYLAIPGWVSAGSTPGVVYQTDLRGNQCAYDVDVSAAITPTASSVASQTFISIGMLLKAS